MFNKPHFPKAKTKTGFTLAEVLITLGIIGIVAAITIPGLMTKYHRHVAETKLAKFDSIINQAARMSIAENDDISYDPPAKGLFCNLYFASVDCIASNTGKSQSDISKARRRIKSLGKNIQPPF